LAKEVRSELSGEGGRAVLPDVRSKACGIRQRFGMGDSAAKATILAVQARLSMGGAVTRPEVHHHKTRLLVEASPSMQKLDGKPPEYEVETAAAVAARAAIRGAKAVLAVRKVAAQAVAGKASKVRPRPEDRLEVHPHQPQALSCSQPSTVNRRLSRRLRVKTRRPSLGAVANVQCQPGKSELKKQTVYVSTLIAFKSELLPPKAQDQHRPGKRHCHRAVEDVGAAAAALATDLKAALDEGMDESSAASLQKERQKMLAVKQKFKCGSEVAAKITLLARARLSMAGLRAKALPYRQTVYLKPTRAQLGLPLRRCRGKTPSAKACAE